MEFTSCYNKARDFGFEQVGKANSLATSKLDKAYDECNSTYNNVTSKVIKFFKDNKLKILFAVTFIGLLYYAPITVIVCSLIAYTTKTYFEDRAAAAKAAAEKADVVKRTNDFFQP